MSYVKEQINTNDYQGLVLAIRNHLSDLGWSDKLYVAYTGTSTTASGDTLSFYNEEDVDNRIEYARITRDNNIADKIEIYAENGLDLTDVISSNSYIRTSSYTFANLYIGDKSITFTVKKDGKEYPSMFIIHEDNNGKICFTAMQLYTTSTSDWQYARGAFVAMSYECDHYTSIKINTSGEYRYTSATVLCPIPTNDYDNGYSTSVFYVPYRQNIGTDLSILIINGHKYLSCRDILMKLE